MRWRDTEKLGSPRGGLALQVDGHRRPGLTIESSASGRIRIHSGARAFLWARIDDGFYGVWILRPRTREPLEIIEPIRSAVAREISTTSGWMRWFARALDSSPRSPLRPGAWQLTRLERRAEPVEHRARGPKPDVFVPHDPDGLPSIAYGAIASLGLPRLHYEDWGVNGSGAVIPLREPNEADSARVKAWRKSARDGTLPPILLWWVGALDAYVILDGHDRLSAAVAEDSEPVLIALWQPLDMPIDGREDAQARYIEAYEKAFANEERLSEVSRFKLNEHLVAFHRRTWRSSITTAKANPRLDESWIAEVTREAEGEIDRDSILSTSSV